MDVPNYVEHAELQYISNATESRGSRSSVVASMLACCLGVIMNRLWVPFRTGTEFEHTKLARAPRSTRREMDTGKRSPGIVKSADVILTILPIEYRLVYRNMGARTT